MPGPGLRRERLQAQREAARHGGSHRLAEVVELHFRIEGRCARAQENLQGFLWLGAADRLLVLEGMASVHHHQACRPDLFAVTNSILVEHRSDAHVQDLVVAMGMHRNGVARMNARAVDATDRADAAIALA